MRYKFVSNKNKLRKSQFIFKEFWKIYYKSINLFLCCVHYKFPFWTSFDRTFEIFKSVFQDKRYCKSEGYNNSRSCGKRNISVAVKFQDWMLFFCLPIIHVRKLKLSSYFERKVTIVEKTCLLSWKSNIKRF